MHVPINRLESRYGFTLGYHIQEQETLSKEVVQPTQEDKLFQGKRNNIFTGVEFYNTLKYPYSISYEEGRKISLQHKYYSNEIGSDLNSREYIVSYAEYFQIPSDYLRHHVIYLSLIGAASHGDRTLQQAFQIGGYPQQSEYPLRGYPSRFATGKYLATGTLEYRAPIWYIFRGIGTKPFFWDRLHMAVFADAGEVWDDREKFSTDRLKTGVGIEARLDMTLGYRLKITPAIGVARGLNEGGETAVYFTINMDL
jgi:hemolysin activation/secretion protein